jgi:hypothetical protein
MTSLTRRLYYARTSVLLWLAAVSLAWTVNPRLGIAAILGSLAFNLSDSIRGRP